MNNIFICDTNVLVSSLFRKNSPPQKTVHHIKSTVGYLAFSDETFQELAEVLKRSKFDKFIAKEKRVTFLEEIQEVALNCEILQHVDLCRDPKDNKFLDVAIASYADYLITGDEDLLVLESIGNTFIITPRKFIEIHNLD